MARPRRSEQRDTRQEILDAALELFAENGFHGTSLRDVARAVGIREGTLYHHFHSKEVLFRTLLLGLAQTPQVARPFLDRPLPADPAVVLERLSLALIESMSTLRARKLFRLAAQDGLRLAARGQLDLWGLISTAREPVLDLLALLAKDGRLRAAPGDLHAIEFAGPLLLWRVLQLIAPDHPWVTDYRAFARAHVTRFLDGALVYDPHAG